MIVERALRGECAADRVLRAAEGDEQSIADGAEFMTGVLGDGVAEDAAVGRGVMGGARSIVFVLNLEFNRCLSHL